MTYVHARIYHDFAGILRRFYWVVKASEGFLRGARMLGLHALGSRMRSEHSQALRSDRQQELLLSPSMHPGPRRSWEVLGGPRKSEFP